MNKLHIQMIIDQIIKAAYRLGDEITKVDDLKDEIYDEIKLYGPGNLETKIVITVTAVKGL